MTRVVLDSNVIVSALVFGGKPRRILEMAEDGRLEMAVSGEIRREVEEVLRVKFGWTGEFVRAACLPIWHAARNVKPAQSLAISVDPDDDRVIECAVEAGAHAIVTGDGDLLRLGAYGDIAIVSPSAFLLLARWSER